jgi:hypothetical protein
MNYHETGIFVIDVVYSMMKFQKSRAKTSWKLLFLLVYVHIHLQCSDPTKNAKQSLFKHFT